MKLKNKFLLIFITISIIPITIVTSFTYDRYTKLIEEQTGQVADNIVDKAADQANDAIGDLKNIAQMFNFYSQTEESIIDNIKKYRENGPGYTDYDVLKSNQKISFICQNLIFSHDYLNGIFIFTPTGPVLGYGYGGNISVHPDYEPDKDDWYQQTIERHGKLYINGLSQKDFFIAGDLKPSLSFSQAIYDVYTHEFLGVLLIDCSPKFFDLSGVNTLPDIAMLAVEDSFGNVLYSNIDSLKTELTPQNTRIRTEDLDMEGFRLLFSINYQELYEEFGYTRTMILTISLICGLVFIILSVYLSYSTTKPIVHLSRKMAIKTGDRLVTTTRYLNRTDEIGVLYNEYNHMIETLSEYIEKELQNKLITLDSQMKSLEAQINSHFLYNTLESINSIAELEEVESISTMALALGDMFRYSIKTQSELVTVADELKHVRDYVSIQRIRFENKFDLKLEIPEEMYSYKVLKLILQPLVENSFYHGLQYCRCGSFIKIRGWHDDKFLFLSVSDDGAGMTKEQKEELEKTLLEPARFTELGQRNKQSIGVKNIHTRIVLYYGEGYGLHIDSEPGEGTTMTIRLPVLFT